MDIEDAFTTEAIEAAGTNVGEEEENALHVVIGTVLQSRTDPPTSEQVIDLAMLCFVAGRTYQYDLPVTVQMSQRMYIGFMNYAMERLSQHE